MTRLRILALVARLLWRAKAWTVELERTTIVDVDEGFVVARYGRGFTLTLDINGGAERLKTPAYIARVQDAP